MNVARRGFLLIDVAIVTTLIAIIGVAIFPASMRFFRLRQFEEQSDAIISALVTARDQSMASKDGTTFGVKFFANRYVIFAGASYATRNTAKDETIPLTNGVVANQNGKYPNEIAFTASGGTASGAIETIEILKGGFSRTVTFNEYGAKTVGPPIDRSNPPPESTGTRDAYWPMDEINGTRYASVGRYDLTDEYPPLDPPSAEGKVQRALETSAGASMRNMSGTLGNANRDFTVAGWLYLGSNAQANLVGGVKDQTNAYSWLLYFDNTANAFSFTLPTIATVRATGAPTLATWYFVAATHNATTHEISISINAGTPTSAPVNGTPSNTSGGIRIENAVSGNRIDELGIWSKVLTQAELAVLYNNGGGTGGDSLPSTLSGGNEPPEIECGALHSSMTLHPKVAQNNPAPSPFMPWGFTDKALILDNNDALAAVSGASPTYTQTLQFRNFKQAGLAPQEAQKTPYGTDKIIINLHILAGINSEDATMRIVRPTTPSANLAVGTSMTRKKIIQYTGGTIDESGGWGFKLTNDDARAIAKDDTSFGLDFEAKLNSALSTARIDAVSMTLCIPDVVNCGGDELCIAETGQNQGGGINGGGGGGGGFGHDEGVLGNP